MDRSTVVLITLVAYKLLLVGIGWMAERWTRNEADFLLGGRRLGPLVAAISASASSASAWTLVGVTGYAYAYGMQALWLFPACVGGFAINWWLVAPRLRRQAAAEDCLTVTEFIAGRQRGPGYAKVRVAGSLILLFSLTAYVASQFHAAGDAFHEHFDLPLIPGVLIGGGIVVLYTLLGGFWAVSITDTLQGLLMAAVTATLPWVALYHVGDFNALLSGIARVDQPGFTSLWGPDLSTGVFAVLALFGISLGYPGQPHVVNRFMALRDEESMHRARYYAMAWASIVYFGVIMLGLCARVLAEDALEPLDHAAVKEQVFFEMTGRLFPPVISGMVLAAVLSAIMSTADSQLLVASSSVSHDLGWRGKDERSQLLRSRLVVLAVSIAAMAVAIWVTKEIFSSVLFAWSAIGAAFGPLLLVTLWQGSPSPARSLLAMLSGFGLSVLAYSLPWSQGTALERVLPFVVALAVLLLWPPRRRLR